MNLKDALAVIKTAAGSFAVRVVIQFSRIVQRFRKSETVRCNVRDELFILKRFRFVVNSLFFVSQSARRPFAKRRIYNVVNFLSTS